MGGTARKAIVIGAGLIAGYLVLKNFKGFSSDVSTAGSSSVNLVKAFQGR
jgi:hypothetical protein